MAAVHNDLEVVQVVDQASYHELLSASLAVDAFHSGHSRGASKSNAWVAVVLCTLVVHAVDNIDLLDRYRCC